MRSEATPVVEAAPKPASPESNPVADEKRTEPANEAPDEFVAVVTGVTERALGHHVVSLDNGQVWQEEFASSYFPVRAGDQVTIKKRLLSGYRLVTESGKGFAVERLP